MSSFGSIFIPTSMCMCIQTREKKFQERVKYHMHTFTVFIQSIRYGFSAIDVYSVYYLPNGLTWAKMVSALQSTSNVDDFVQNSACTEAFEIFLVWILFSLNILLNLDFCCFLVCLSLSLSLSRFACFHRR